MRCTNWFWPAAAFLPWLANTTAGQCLTQTNELTAADAEAGDQFAMAVATDGATIVVGADQEDELGIGAGAAYVFEQTGGAWTQTAKLSASDGDGGDNFGHSVAVSGDTILIGAFQDEAAGATAGSVYVFRRSGGNWTQTQKLLAADGGPGDRFGSAVAIDGPLAVIGASTDDGVAPDSGSAYVFELVSGTWTQQQRLDAGDGQTSDQAGAAVAVRGELIAVGALFGDGAQANSGAVYVFGREAGPWAQTAKLVAVNGESGARFGHAVSLDGEVLAVGARAAAGGATGSGAAYVFERTAGTWTQAAAFELPTPEDNAGFGFSVAAAGVHVVVGASRADAAGVDSGTAYLYGRVAGVWAELGAVVGAGVAAGERYGETAAMAGPTLVIGAPLDDDAAPTAGSAYVFAISPESCCEPCDTNCDGSLNGFDISVFIDALSGQAPTCSPCAADSTGDGSVNGFDIAGFIACLSGAP